MKNLFNYKIALSAIFVATFLTFATSTTNAQINYGNSNNVGTVSSINGGGVETNARGRALLRAARYLAEVALVAWDLLGEEEQAQKMAKDISKEQQVRYSNF